MKTKSLLKIPRLLFMFVLLFNIYGCCKCNTFTLVSFLPTTGPNKDYAVSYFYGIDYFVNTHDDLKFEYKNYEEYKIRSVLKKKSTKAIIGGFHSELINHPESNNDKPVITSISAPTDYKYNKVKPLFLLTPSLSEEVKALTDLLESKEELSKVSVIYSGDLEMYENMYFAFNEYALNLNYETYKLSPEHNAYSSTLNYILEDNSDAFLFFTNVKDTNALIEELVNKNNNKSLYIPSYLTRFLSLPSRYSSEKFSINYPVFGNTLNIDTEILHSEFFNSPYLGTVKKEYPNIINANFNYFVDGYLATAIVNSLLAQNNSAIESTKELNNLLHESTLFTFTYAGSKSITKISL